MKKKFEFTEDHRKLIQEAVADLESKTAGELVIYFARSSNSYMEACWKLTALLGISVALLFGVLSWQWMLPADISIFTAMLYVVLSMIFGFAVPFFIPRIRMALVPAEYVDHSVLTKARDVFLEEQVFNTIDRVGILFYISELEHKVQVIGDQGINKKISSDDWQRVVDIVIEGIKAGSPAQGIAKSIAACQKLLLDNGFDAKSNEGTNELSDEIRVED